MRKYITTVGHMLGKWIRVDRDSRWNICMLVYFYNLHQAASFYSSNMGKLKKQTQGQSQEYKTLGMNLFENH